MPQGTDTVVIQELTARDGDMVTVQKTDGERPQRSRARASTSRKGQTLLAQGRRLTDRDVMLAAAMNYPTRERTPPPKNRRARHRR